MRNKIQNHEGCVRRRLSVPYEDESVIRWLDCQVNMSVSLRSLIREDIRKNGYTDVTCREVVQGPKVGRPSNAEIAARTVVEAEEPVQKVTPSVAPVVTPVAKPQMEQPIVSPVVVNTVAKREEVQASMPKAHFEDEDGVVDPEKLLGI